MSDYILFIAGSRNFTPLSNEDEKMIAISYLSDVFDKYGYPSEIVHGNAHGADTEVTDIAMAIIPNNDTIKLSVFPADWAQYGKKAGPIRNNQMADYMVSTGKDVVAVVFYNPEISRGSAHMVSLLNKKLPNAIKIFHEDYSIK